MEILYAEFCGVTGKNNEEKFEKFIAKIEQLKETVGIKKMCIRDSSVDVQDKDKCKRYCARMVKNVKIGPSPSWMQERLRAVSYTHLLPLRCRQQILDCCITLSVPLDLQIHD